MSEKVVNMLTAPKSDELPLATREKPVFEPLEGYTFDGYTFDGYKNPDGSAGTKNLLGISTSVQYVAGMADYVVKLVKKTL